MNPKDHSPAPLSPEEKNRAKRRAYYLRHQEKERAKNRERYHRNKNKPAVESLPEADKEECKEYGRKAKRITPERREELRRINKSAIKRLKATQQKMADEKEDEK
jgi:predicted transglutaminase-like cysteine proteinase